MDTQPSKDESNHTSASELILPLIMKNGYIAGMI